MFRHYFLAALFVFALAITACDDGNPAGMGDEPDDARRTIEGLITEYLPAVYSEMDSAGYAAALDTSYQFQLLPDDVDPHHPDQDCWDWTAEMTIAGRMFSGWLNQEAKRILTIELYLGEESRTALGSSYPGKPHDEVWYEVVALVDMTVVVWDGAGVGAGEVQPYIVLSRQEFVVRPDPKDQRKWVIVRQEDRPYLNKSAGGSGTDEISWGGLKTMFLFGDSYPISSK